MCSDAEPLPGPMPGPGPEPEQELLHSPSSTIPPPLDIAERAGESSGWPAAGVDDKTAPPPQRFDHPGPGGGGGHVLGPDRRAGRRAEDRAAADGRRPGRRVAQGRLLARHRHRSRHQLRSATPAGAGRRRRGRQAAEEHRAVHDPGAAGDGGHGGRLPGVRPRAGRGRRARRRCGGSTRRPSTASSRSSAPWPTCRTRTS